MPFTVSRSLSKTTALAMAATLLLTSCTAVTNDESSPSATEPTTVLDANLPAELADYYTQSVKWEACGSTLECATVEVPLNYAKPDGERIELALNRRKAQNAQGNLLVNPGGPGGSGLTLVSQSATSMFTPELQRSYNLIGFDPRGVGESSPITCQSDAEKDDSRQSNLHAWDPADREQIVAEGKKYAQDCAQHTGELLGHVDTISAARDMDIIRALLGDRQLDYLGFSYGTFLGATYADLFPQRAGRLVLDGAMDPALSEEEVTLGQAKGFEDSIDAWLTDCLEYEDCPFSGTLDEAKTELQDFFSRLEGTPMTSSDGRQVPVVDFVTGFIVPLYDNSSWPLLRTAMQRAMNGDVDGILFFADLSNERTEEGKYLSNSMDAFTAINCLDRPMDASEAAMEKQAQRLSEASPTIGKYLAYGAIGCDTWSYEPTGKPANLSATGAGPILVVGTTGDPATPYAWAQSLAKQLDNARLLTFEGEGHTAYGRGSDCINEAVDNYLLEGTLPAEGTHC
ncbi:alpha/beta hydrolase [Glutamicibacter sp. PS]|uniref:alpha/beta hydrolase n=1 Tax=Glutamicibacter sp. PS TaxID=3075634 RepID=UPI00283C82B6|nr:alpha/beta hydrolase [Glutamicibacter sp. PS]MDR4533873.1 alpha/beta hydrolase [Glutamicibacter sp. PS]